MLFVNACESKDPTNKIAVLKAKCPQVFAGLGKLKNFHLKLNMTDSVPLIT